MDSSKINFLPNGYFNQLKIINNVSFTARELDIISCLVNLRGGCKIASILDITPRTIETHIANIKRKIEHSSREVVIDFIEKSGKSYLIRKHYRHLLIQADFKKRLRQISTIVNHAAPVCYFFSPYKKSNNLIVATIQNHLKLTGIKLIICDKEEIISNKQENHSFICVIPKEVNNQPFIVKALQEYKNNPQLITFLVIEKLSPELTQQLTKIAYINFLNCENYYLTIIEILKRIFLKINFDHIATKLRQYHDVITKDQTSIVDDTSHFLETILPPKFTAQASNTSKYSKLLVVILATLILSIGLKKTSTKGSTQITTNKITNINHKHVITSYLPEILTSYEQFIGREKELKQIETFLQNNNIVVITGRGGIGKSSCAIEYGKLNKNKKLIRHFNAESINKIDQQYQDLARELEINTGKQQRNLVMQLVHNKLSQLPNKILFILDNVAQYEDVKEYLANFPDNIKTVITTRLPNLATNIPHIALEEFSNEEAEKYLSNSLQNRNFSKELSYNLIENIGTLPYDIKCVAAYLLDYLSIDHKITTNYIKSVIKDSLLVEFITSNDQTKQQAWKILQYISYLDPDFISLDIIKSLLPKDIELSSLALKKLESLSLISIVNNQNNQVGLKIHRNLQKNIQNSLKYHIKCQEHQQKLIDNLLATLNELFPQIEFNPSTTWQTASSFTPHIEKLLDVDKILNQKLNLTAKNNKINVSDLSYKLAKYHLIVTVNYLEAFKYANLALEQTKDVYTVNSPELGNVYYIIGVISRKLGNILEGLAYSQQGLQIRQQIYSGDHPDIADSLYSVGNLYNQNGELQEGLKYSQMALDMYKRLYPKSHPKIGYSLNVVGVCYIDLGDFEKSLEHFKAGFKVFTNLEPINYEGAATLQSNIAYSYNKLGDHAQAVRHAQASLDVFRKLYPNGHPRIVYSLNDLGESLIGNNKINQGLNTLHQALDLSKKFGMDKHCATIFVLDDLGAGYLKKKDYQKALEYTEKSFNLRKERYGTVKNHPSLAQSLHNLGDIYCSLSNQVKGLQLYIDALNMYKALSLEHLPEVNEIKKKIKALESSSML